MKNDKTSTAGPMKNILRTTTEQEEIFTIEDGLTFEEKFSPETIKQLKDKDILEVIIKSCPAKLFLNGRHEEGGVNKE